MSSSKKIRASTLNELADEFGISPATLRHWIDTDTVIGMVKAGWNPILMPRLLPPKVVQFLRDKWGVNDK
ncbi:MAG: hypothetical protein ACK4GN_08235 [Runella sp.]